MCQIGGGRREIFGIEEAVLDQVVEGSRFVGDDSYFIPEVNNIYKMILQNPEITIERPEEYLEEVRKWKREFGKI